MTLRSAELSAESVEQMRSHLSELAGRAGFPQRALTRANPLALDLAVPHDVYFLGLSDLADGVSLEAATLIGRRVLVMDGDQAIASAELGTKDNGSEFHSNEGPFVASTATAITRADEDPELAGGDYEVRLLRIPALYFMGLWLKRDGDGNDVVIPLDPAPPPFEPSRKYAPEELLSALREPARARLAFDDVGKHPE
jgi:hypothetical protein